ncbi:patatin-like phospholipase family protein [Risungbinella massiliensis]|uniref:patatin-like phospholipase family protein n=1 Tax=Risungbinella massiliensis TaxID=1329796 RepID=UPI0005CB96CD|nr:patatin-like phospholipase family protein [Risungbinella massiliensis]
MWADAVFEGGGVKGIGLVGALCVAEKKGYQWKRIAGTSAGSIIASLLAAGYTGEELYQLMLEKSFSDFLHGSWYDFIPFVGPSLRILTRKGMYRSDRIESWLSDLLAAKGIRTFADLKEKELHIVVSDISNESLLVFPKDLDSLGYDPGEFSIAKAVRISCNIPFFFEPFPLYNRKNGTYNYLVDGGLLSNFPIWLFDEEQPRWPTFGFRLMGENTGKAHQIHGPISLFKAIFETMMDAHDNRLIAKKDEARTIFVPTLDVKLTDFDIDKERRDALFKSGVQAAELFFNHWTFDSYLVARGKKKGVNIQIGNENKEVR